LNVSRRIDAIRRDGGEAGEVAGFGDDAQSGVADSGKHVRGKNDQRRKSNDQWRRQTVGG